MIGVGALVVGLVAMAFAVGRAQAQVRSRWVATARALGATRSTIVTASLVESATVGLVAGGIGSALGYAAGTAHIALLNRTVPDPFFPAHLVVPWWAVPGLLVLALVLSAIIGAIPALWSARVAPVAALKPVTDLSEADISRRVSVRPLVIAWSTALGAAAAMTIAGASGALLGIWAFAALVVLVGGVMLMHEALRWAVPRAGMWLSRAHRRAPMIAGDSLIARPRQATIPAFVVALGVGTMIAVGGYMAAHSALDTARYNPDNPHPVWFSTAGIGPAFLYQVMLAVAVTTIVTIAVTASTAVLTAREAATREALGATRQDGRIAGAIAYGVMQITGITLGIVVGLLGAVGLLAAAQLLPTGMDTLRALSAVVIPALWIPCIAASGAVVGAKITASFTPSPVSAARLESST